MASAGSGGAFAFATAGAAVASTNGVGAQVWVVEKDDFDAHPFTGLLEAIRGRDVNRVRMLLSSVGNLDAATAPMPPMTPPLVEAAAVGDWDILNLLLERSPSLDVRDVGLGGTPLHWAATLPQVDALEALLRRAPSTDVKAFGGATPLHIAAEAGSLAGVKLLLSRNADAAAADEAGDTPLHRAATEGHLPVVETLLSSHVDPSVINLQEETALLQAARRGFSSIVDVRAFSWNLPDLLLSALLTLACQLLMPPSKVQVELCSL
eukprot:jgi/Botrbrau1/15467/Bobra.43_2s0089.2